MRETSVEFYKTLFVDLDPEKLARRFLETLLKIQGVERGSIWLQRNGVYQCIESLGSKANKDTIKGVCIGADQPSIVGWVIENAEMTIAEAGKDPRHYKGFEDDMEIKSTCILCFPLILKTGEVYGAVQLIETDSGGNRLNLDEEFLKHLKSIVDVGSIALSNALNYTEQLDRSRELEQTLDVIRSEVQIIGQSRSFLNVMKKVREYGRTEFPVLITGESGTGKDLIALALHNLSARKDKPFVVQNCSAIPDTLLESELFGYKKGAFTGAIENKIGLLQSAHGGTVFLDEIGDMSFNLQARILRVIQNQEIKPLGHIRTTKINVRIISATNKDLRAAITRKEFREDLFHRLNVLPLHLPPLRERKKDIPLLLNYFMKRESMKLGVSPKVISEEVMQHLEIYDWEGNIRELENLVKYILSTVDNATVCVSDIPDHLKKKELEKISTLDENLYNQEQAFIDRKVSLAEKTESLFTGFSWRELEKAYAEYLLEKNKWNVTRAAKEAGLNRSTFDSKIKKLGVRKA